MLGECGEMYELIEMCLVTSSKIRMDVRVMVADCRQDASKASSINNQLVESCQQNSNGALFVTDFCRAQTEEGNDTNGKIM